MGNFVPTHPRRLFCNAAGDFYATGEDPKPGEKGLRWMGDCLTCHGPESQAPDLLAELNEKNATTYFVRQPIEGDEIERACRALQYCCVDALRYGGTDLAIIRRLGNNPAYCDHLVTICDRLVYCLDDQGDLLPWAAEIRNAIGMGRNTPPVPDQ